MSERFIEKVIEIIIKINGDFRIVEVLRKSFSLFGMGVSTSRIAYEICGEKRLVRLSIDILSLVSSFATGGLEFLGLNAYSKYAALASTVLIYINMPWEDTCNLPEIDDIAHEIAQDHDLYQ